MMIMQILIDQDLNDAQVALPTWWAMWGRHLRTCFKYTMIHYDRTMMAIIMTILD